MNAKMILALLGLAVFLYLAWPIIKMIVWVQIYRFLLDYGFYLLLLIAGGGYYLWHRLKS